jgi:hypothetical protein
MATVFRAPLSTQKRPAVRAAITFIAPNLLLTAGAAVPFNQDAWPVPPRHPWVNRTWTRNLLQSPLGAFLETSPLRPFDWPVPWRYPWEDYTYTQNLLQSTLEGFTLTTPFTPLAWPLDQRRVGQGLTWYQNLLSTTLIPSVGDPFFLVDWPVPRQAARRDLTWIQNLLQGTLEGFTGTTPFAQLDWPLGLRRAYRDITWTQNLLGTLLVTIEAAPFFLVDWPIPRLLPRQDLTWTQGPRPVEVVPFSLTDWPLPRRIEKPNLTWAQNLLQGTLEGFTLTTPFSQLDWPVPKPKFYSNIPLGASVSSFQDLLAAVGLSRLTALSLLLSPDIAQTFNWTGNVVPVQIVSQVPTSTPPGGRGVVFYVSGATVRVYVWDGAAWQVLT